LRREERRTHDGSLATFIDCGECRWTTSVRGQGNRWVTVGRREVEEGWRVLARVSLPAAEGWAKAAEALWQRHRDIYAGWPVAVTAIGPEDRRVRLVAVPPTRGPGDAHDEAPVATLEQAVRAVPELVPARDAPAGAGAPGLELRSTIAASGALELELRLSA